MNLRRKRFDGGALRLDQVKLQFALNNDTGLPCGYSVYEQKDSNRSVVLHSLPVIAVVVTLPYHTFGVGRLLHLPSAEAVSVRPNAQPRCNQKVTVIGFEAENRL